MKSLNQPHHLKGETLIQKLCRTTKMQLSHPESWNNMRLTLDMNRAFMGKAAAKIKRAFSRLRLGSMKLTRNSYSKGF